MAKSKSRIPVVTFDAETDPFEHGETIEPFVWGYYDGHVFRHFWGAECTEDFVDFLREQRVIAYAHNGGKFDFFYLFPYMDRGSIKLVNGRILECRIGKAILRDSFAILPIPLAQYIKDEIDYWKMKRDVREQHHREIIDYLATDCVSLFDLVSGFIERFGRKITIASASMAQLKETLGAPIDKFTDFQDEKYRRYYYGGRCQAFEYGRIEGPLQIYDINSAYPYAMTHEHPDPCFNSWDITHRLPRNKDCYFATIKARSFGALPYRDEKANKLTFPDDGVQRTYHVTGWEIKAGLETGTLKIDEVLEVRVPDQTRNFSEFVRKFYAEKVAAKREGRKSDEIFAKLILNSSYGKFALNPRDFKEWEIVNYGELPPDAEVKDGKIIDPKTGYEWKSETSWREFGIDIFSRPDPSLWGFYNVAVAASITGFVRAYLWRTICAADRPVYCDTDSIVCRGADISESDSLGAWKHEGTASVGYFGGRKLYALYLGNLSEGQPDFDYVKDPERAKLARTDKDRWALANKEERKAWKTASKGSRLTPRELKLIAEDGEEIEWENPAPTYSLTRGVRYVKRNIRMVK